MSGGFLKEERLDASWSVAEPGISAIAALDNGSADVVQSTLSQSLMTLSKGDTPSCVHFAQINEMDGFFLTGRREEPDFEWKKLEGAEVVLFGGGQPLVMFKYACHKAGIDFDKINVTNVGGAADMDRAFREGTGQYVQQQGPFPQQIEADGAGHVVAQVGPMIGPCGFSSLAAKSEWLQSDIAAAFTRAYAKTRAYMNEESAAEIAKAQKSYFPKVNEAVLAHCIGTYQQLGCWTPHIEISDKAYEAMLDIYQYAGGLTERFPYEQVCAAPPKVV